MILSVSLRSLLRHRTRTVLAIAGIGVSSALLLNMTMLAGGLTGSFEELIGLRGFTLRVTPAGSLPFDTEAGIRDAGRVAALIRDVDGVRAVAPVLGAQLYRVVEEGDGHERVFASGVVPEDQLLYELLEGRNPEPGEVLVSQPLADAPPWTPGREVVLAGRLDPSLGRPRDPTPFRISGTGDFLFDYAGQRSIALPLADLQRLVDRPDEVSLFGVGVVAGADEEAVAAAIERAVPGVSAYSTGDLVSALDEQLLYFRQLAAILGSVALVVTALLIGTIVTIGVRERFGEIATLRALGIARHRILGGVVAEGLLIALVGCLVGLPLGYWMAGQLDAILLDVPGIPARVSFFVIDPPRVAGALTIVIGVGVAAGLLPGARAVTAPVVTGLREEAE